MTALTKLTIVIWCTGPSTGHFWPPPVSMSITQYLKVGRGDNGVKKSRIPETKHLPTDADSSTNTAEWFLINLPLTILKEIIELQKILYYSLHKLRFIR